MGIDVTTFAFSDASADAKSPLVVLGHARVEQTEPLVFSPDETLDVGDELGSPVTYDHPTPKKFNGRVNWVEIDVDEAAADADHLLSPEERLRLIVGRQ